MSTVLIILAAVAVGVLLVGGIAGASVLLSDRNRSPDPQSQGDTQSGSGDGCPYIDMDFGGGDGGGDE
ncbi:MAG: hypothetical protein AAGH57_03425 [Pseudomonadota bacterium]